MPPLNLHFIGFSTVPGPGTMGGGTRIFLELARRLQARPDIRLTVYVSEAALATCRAAGLDDRTTFRAIPDRIDNRFYSPAAHVTVSRSGLRLLADVRRQPGDGPHVVYSGSNFWPDVASGSRLARQLQGLWVASVYLFAPNPLYGYLGEFTRQLHWPEPLPVLNWFYERTFMPVIRREAGMVFLTNDYDRQRLRGARAFPDHLHAVYGGVDLDEARSAPPDPSVEYAGAFVGRLHPMKGVAQLLHIWAEVVRQRPEARLALIGVGRDDYVRAMQRLCHQLGLDRAVDWLGYRDGPAKYALLKRTKVFLHTSIYDNNGMVACEAMSVGLPVVLFDLPPLRIAYPQGALRAPIGDLRAFADCALHLLSDEALRARLSQEGLALAAQWSWDQRTDAALGRMRDAVGTVAVH
jgi:glycosyltransferase involved in cell wall biosynthesis